MVFILHDDKLFYWVQSSLERRRANSNRFTTKELHADEDHDHAKNGIKAAHAPKDDIYALMKRNFLNKRLMNKNKS